MSGKLSILGEFWSLVTDDIFPTDLRDHGHIDGLLRRVIAAGVPVAKAMRHATFIPARHYGLVDRGAIAPSYRADLVVLDDARDCRVAMTLKSGTVVAANGEFLGSDAAPRIEPTNTVRVATLDESNAPPPITAIGPLGDGLLDATEKRALTKVEGSATCGDRRFDLTSAVGGKNGNTNFSSAA